MSIDSRWENFVRHQRCQDDGLLTVEDSQEVLEGIRNISENFRNCLLSANTRRIHATLVSCNRVEGKVFLKDVSRVDVFVDDRGSRFKR